MLTFPLPPVFWTLTGRVSRELELWGLVPQQIGFYPFLDKGAWQATVHGVTKSGT